MTTTTTADVRRLELEDAIRYADSVIVAYEQRLAELEAELPRLDEENGRAGDALSAHAGQLLRVFAEQAESSEPRSMNPPASWRAFHGEASAILDAHSALEATANEASKALTRCDGERSNVGGRELPMWRQRVLSLRTDLERLEASEAAAMAQYKHKGQSTLAAMRRAFGFQEQPPVI